MENAVQHAARTLGLPEPVLENFLTIVKSLRTWDDSNLSEVNTSSALRLAQPAARPFVNTEALFDALIDEYDRKL
jgi:hypothetical protein